MTHQDDAANPSPACVTDYINQVIRRMRYSRSARREVRQELLDHFADALADYPDPPQRQKLAETLITGFGDTKMLAALLRRAKKRNRPSWIKALIRTAQGFLLLIVLFVLYTAWFMTGRPTISTNYIALLTEKTQPKVAESENAWPFYSQAVLEFVATGRITPPDPTQPPYDYAMPETDTDLAGMPDVVQAGLRKWVDENEAGWQSYLAASRKPYCWYSYAVMDDLQMELARTEAERKDFRRRQEAKADGPAWKDSVLTILLPHLGAVRQLSRIGIWKSRFESSRGDTRQAIEHVLAIASVARHWQNGNRFAIEQLVGIAVNNLACEEIRRLAADRNLTAADLQRIQERLDGLYRAGYPAFGVEGERIGLADTVQRVFTEGGPGGGHLVPPVVIGMWNETGARAGSALGFSAAVSLVHAGRDQTLAVGNAFYRKVAEGASLTPYQRIGRCDPEQMLRDLSWPRYWFLSSLLPNFSKAADLNFHGRAEYEATLAVLALQRYRLDKGQYPPDLETLVRAGYLRQVPMDPYSDGPLVYRSTGDAFTLYSLAGNFQDDGGVQNPKDPWNSRQAGSSARGASSQAAPATQPTFGDRVFWPVAPLKPYPVDLDWQQAASGR